MSNAPSMKHTAPRLELVQKAAGLAALAAFTLTACTANDEPADTNQGAAESPDTETPADGQTDDTDDDTTDRKSTRLNSSHVSISYAVFCLKKKNKTDHRN